jgi:pyruvate/2-oxoacid:ferredoxin oxidoreductase alpha subunit
LTATLEVLTGNGAAAYGAKLSRAEVVAAYPITPQTALVEKIQELINLGQMDAEYINVESEHSAMAACVGASIGGARAFTATSAQGLLLMHEMLFWAGYGRLPIVMAVVTRGIAPPWNMWSDHTDALAQRDTGWVQIFCHDNQEILDTIIQAYRIGEDKRVMLPVMVCYDGFEISHTSENLLIPSQVDVDNFLPRYENDLVNPASPKLLGNGALPDDAAVFRRILKDVTGKIPSIMEEINANFDTDFGRGYEPVETYGSPDSEIVIIAMGSVASTAKAAIDILNKEGVSVGLARIRVFRPFPAEILRRRCVGSRAIIVLDRDMSFGRGILSTEAKSAFQGAKEQPKFFEFLAGLGGETVRCNDIVNMVKKLAPKIATTEQREVEWLRTR